MQLKEHEQEALADTLSTAGWQIALRVLADKTERNFYSLFQKARQGEVASYEVGKFDSLAEFVQALYVDAGLERSEQVDKIFKRNR